ncbi:DNA-3-methyladenine glycosylase [Actinotignum timonense]|uniref:Putative 3-methyladenine DNA glycosylase n=1 Tax=Actinotignum schaalii FB123-CNA-2 TaxID=883067 RepID=S2VMQ4_9ACTO|nr:DNA-3-methyladenine glycosylase [Actinotignum schaalii]EPD28748.1 DNA-3-methyladenine glycosylase [Actinotignum schaalii FB123-CNA-2]
MARTGAASIADLSRPADELAPLLLGAVIGDGAVAVRLTEVEAYLGAEDPASHAFAGPTPRARVMFGPPAHLYVYLSYGIHRIGNIVCGPDGQASAVLLRAGEVVAGLEEALRRRTRPGAAPPARQALARGPGNVGQVLGLDTSMSGLPLTVRDADGGVLDPAITPDPAGLSERCLWLELPPAPLPYRVGPRIGISRNTDAPLRFWLPGDPTVSGRR